MESNNINQLLLSKGELLTFNIGRYYGTFLLSLQKHFSEALQEKLKTLYTDRTLEIESKIYSAGKHFNIEKLEFLADYSSEMEEIIFKIETFPITVHLQVAGCAGIQSPGLELSGSNIKENSKHALQKDASLKDLFTDNILQICATWLATEKISEEDQKQFFKRE